MSHDALIAVEPETQKLIVLDCDLKSVTAEIQRGRWHLPAQVVHVKDQILIEYLALPEDHPAKAWWRQAIFVPRRINRQDARQPEVPTVVGIQKRIHKASGCAVD